MTDLNNLKFLLKVTPRHYFRREEPEEERRACRSYELGSIEFLCICLKVVAPLVGIAILVALRASLQSSILLLTDLSMIFEPAFYDIVLLIFYSLDAGAWFPSLYLTFEP